MRGLASLLGMMAMVAAGFFLVLRIGFALHHDLPPAPLGSRGLAVASALVLLSGGGIAISRAARYVRRRTSSARAVSARSEARRLRAAELAADPERARYAPLVLRGENWSNEDIDYYENPDRTVTCAHLQPIEQALRRAGVDARRYRESDVSARCRIDFPALERLFPIAAPVRYAEFYAGERSECDHPMAFLICDEHKAAIHTLHPEAASAETVPWFPARPDSPKRV